jgi:hypothetical protein
LIEQLSASVCVPEAGNQPVVGTGANQQDVACEGHCSAYECQIGAACLPLPDGGDPCNAAGFVCDESNEVCRDPQLFEPCQPGGPACEPFPQSTVPISCINLDVFGDGELCLQPCSQTSDCADPLLFCDNTGDAVVGGGFCDADQCTTNFARCAAEATVDGICEPQGPQYSFCHQETADGGTAGQACDVYDNRQRGQFCAFPNICNSGICAPACNAGTSGVPGCATGTSCFGVQGINSDPADLGACSVPCDFTSPDGGGCAQVTGGPVQKCLPQFILTGVDSQIGFCVAEVPSPLGVGQDCPTEPSGLDGCAAGLLCLQPSLTQNARCFQMCNLVASSPGTGGCPANQVCTALNDGSGVQPTEVGYCQ